MVTCGSLDLCAFTLVPFWGLVKELFARDFWSFKNEKKLCSIGVGFMLSFFYSIAFLSSFMLLNTKRQN